jgi:hydroxymethylglutaryl-CoA lyase
MRAHVLWTDVAPRDGLQNVAASIDTEAKVRLVRGLLDSGMPRVEATAFVSPKWVPQLADAADLLGAISDSLQRVRVLIPNPRGLELALQHGVRNVLVTIGATDSFNRRNVNRDVQESMQDLQRIVTVARQNSCTVDVALSVSFGCPFEGRVDPNRVVELCARIADAGADEVGIADTIGVATPSTVASLTTSVAARVPLERISLHVHDTRGQGVANVLSAYREGVRRFDGSAGGVGGCPFAPRSTGNVCSEDALLALDSVGATFDTNLAALCDVSTQLERDLGVPLPGKLYRAGLWTGEPQLETSGARSG